VCFTLQRTRKSHRDNLLPFSMSLLRSAEVCLNINVSLIHSLTRFRASHNSEKELDTSSK